MHDVRSTIQIKCGIDSLTHTPTPSRIHPVFLTNPLTLAPALTRTHTLARTFKKDVEEIEAQNLT